jgi:hypothetical protein
MLTRPVKFATFLKSWFNRKKEREAIDKIYIIEPY